MDTMERANAPKRRKSSNGQQPDGRKRKRKKGNASGAKAGVIAGLLFASMMIGLIIGYSVIGNEPVYEVFSPSTWKHLFLLIFG